VMNRFSEISIAQILINVLFSLIIIYETTSWDRDYANL